MKIIAMIPARYAATRFPYKLMQPLGSKTVIRHTYDNTLATGLFDDVFVVTDHKIIYDEITANGGNAIMSLSEHESGSDRIAEAIADMDVDIVLNVQGDEPFVNAHMLKKLLDVFADDDEKKVKVASPVKKILNTAHAVNPNIVKVVVDNHMNSLLFSRSLIPFYRDETIIPFYYEHVGVYAFRKEALLLFTVWEMTPLEKAEKIECLRYLEHGIQLRMVETEDAGVKIDMPEDLAKAEAYLKTML